MSSFGATPPTLYPTFALPSDTPADNSSFIGNPLTTSDPAHTRIFFGNIRGFQFRDDGSSLLPALQTFQRWNADVVCLSEHNVDSCQAAVRHRVHEDVRSVFEHSSHVLSSSPIPMASTVKRGGTFSVVVSDMVGRLIRSVRDRLGRWTAQVFQGRAARRVAIVSVYQVCVPSGDNAKGKLTESAWSQQVSALQSDGISDPDPRRQFTTDLISFLQ